MSKKKRDILIFVSAVFLIFGISTLIFLCTGNNADGFIKAQEFDKTNEIVLTTETPVSPVPAAETFTVFEENDPDIQMHPASVAADGKQLRLTFAEPLNQDNPHMVKAPELVPGAGPVSVEVSRSYWAYLLSILISALLINNYVFTKYLGLCVFMGTSKRKSTATGMGIVFMIVMLVSAVMSWIVNRYVLVPFHLDFLQVVVFIGLVSLTVQAVDTILRKINPILFNAFGVFLVLVIANCIIIAVPLYMASNQYNLIETIMLALGAGGGFLLALYLMSSVRERLELARIPESFKGLPIAFIVAGQFALAFLGFSGLQIH
ncbi:MAG: NADH-quinone reductase [Proteobacteria bacterium]|nr:NADH-quinone reductase [Pseudomonadota bacterium]